jgi:MHS family proline/betaine transporter-like MFS transporter
MKNNSSLKVVLAAITGHALEFYDFTIYAVFALKIGELFFPNSSEFAQILSSLAVFAVGFVMRPVGGVVFGHIGDKYGRRRALIIAVSGMAIITFLVGLLPDYNSIGIAAPIMLVVFRLIQGLCVGGEGAGASIFVLEHMKGLKPGLVGGIVNAALTLGILLAILVGMFMNSYFGVDSNGWRYAFMLGGVFGMGSLYLLLSVSETPVFEEMKASKKIVELPIREVFRTNLKNVILTVAVGGLTGASGYFVMTYLNVFFKTVMMVDANTALYYTALGNLGLIIFLPVMGALSDRLGYTKTISLGCVIVLFSSTAIFQMLCSTEANTVYSGILLLSALVSVIYAPLYPFMLGLFTPEQRYSGIACCLNLGIALFGGTCSMVCLWLINSTQEPFAAAYYWNFVSAMFLIALAAIKPRKVIGYFIPSYKATI